MRIHAILLLVAQAGAVVVLARRGLWRTHLALVTYLTGCLVQSVILMPLNPATTTYLNVWLWSLPVLMVLQIWLAGAAYRRSLHDIPRAERTSHFVVWSICLLAAAVAQAGQTTYTALGVLSRAYQAVAMVLATSAFLIAALVGLLRPERPRNVVYHERILATHFASLAALLFLLHRGSLWVGVVNAWLSVGTCVAWALLLTREGEERPPTPHVSGQDRARAEQLAPIERSLSSALGRIFR